MGIIYTLLNVPSNKTYNLSTYLDQSIPFIKAFIIPYMLWMPFLYLTFIYLCIKDRNLYYRTLLTYNLAVLVSYLVYHFCQTTIVRPEITGNGLLSEWTAFVYHNDQPYNCFPSIHCMSSFLLFTALLKSQIKTELNLILIGTASFLIILSTLFVKQHLLIDVIGGIALAEGIFIGVSHIQWPSLFSSEKLLKLSKKTLQSRPNS
jgi:membrane-associated phospholipid phosphatase